MIQYGVLCDGCKHGDVIASMWLHRDVLIQRLIHPDVLAYSDGPSRCRQGRESPWPSSGPPGWPGAGRRLARPMRPSESQPSGSPSEQSEQGGAKAEDGGESSP